MSGFDYNVKAYSTTDISKPVKEWSVEKVEVIPRDRYTRAQKPTIQYILSDALSETLPLEQSLVEKEEAAASAPLPSSDTSGSSSSADEQIQEDIEDRHPTAREIQSSTRIHYPRPQESPPSPPYVPPPYVSSASADTLSDASSSDNSDGSVGNNLIVYSDSDTEMDVDNSTVSPQNFKGMTTENATDWLRHFENFCAYKGYDEARIKALFRVMLIESAAVWYDSLATTTTDSWEQTKDAFKTRYTTQNS